MMDVTQGRMVRYVESDGKVWPAVVTEVDDASDRVSLFVIGKSEASFVHDVTYAEVSKEAIPQTWHWPPRV